MVYPNADHYDPVSGWKTDPDFNPLSYSEITAKWFEQGVRIIGGCCGTGPEFIRHIEHLKK